MQLSLQFFNTTSELYFRSPLNYIGGKFKLLSQLIPLIPSNIDTFVDLFCGGCNVGINIKAKRIIFNDNLTYLIDFYKEIPLKGTENIISHIENRIYEFNLSLTNEEGYKKLRTLYNTHRNPLDLFVLIAYSFNHQVRFNSNHDFNNPFGKKRSSFNPTMKLNLKRFCDVILSKNVIFQSHNFDEIDFSNLTENDYVYCDPPYLITTGTYNDGKRGFTGWNHDTELKLLNILDLLNSNNIGFGLSNVITHKGKKNTILLNWLNKKDYKIFHLHKSYKNSNYHSLYDDKYITDEVFITNKIPNEVYRQ